MTWRTRFIKIAICVLVLAASGGGHGGAAGRRPC